MAEAKWTGVLSTTEPRNDVGIIKVRQGNINSEIAEFQIVQNNKPYDLTGLTVYFCASFGLNLVEKPAVVVNTTGGKIQYTFDDDSMQSVGRQKGYFSIKKEDSKIDSTQDFEFQVESSLMTRSIDGKSYIYKLSTLIKVLDDFIKNGQNNFNTWFESVKEILYGVDPGGNILRELIEARRNSSGNIFASLKARLDKNEDDTAAQLAQTMTQTEFDSWVATLLDGGPSIYMETLSALIVAYPNGAAGVALVRETNPAKIYVWKNSAWTFYGDYQGLELKDDAVTWNNLGGSLKNFISVSKNLVKPSNIIPDMFVNTTGATQINTGYNYVNIPLSQINLSGKTIYFSMNGIPIKAKYVVCFYSGGVTVVSENLTDVYSFTVPTKEITSVTVSYPKSLGDYNKIQIELSGVTDYKPYGLAYVSDESSGYGINYTPKKVSSNLLNINTIIKNYYMSLEGNSNYNTAYIQSAEIKVNTGDVVYFSNDGIEKDARYVVAKKETVVSTVDGKQNVKSYVVPSGVTSLIVSYSQDFSKFQIEKNQVTVYKPYGIKIIEENYLDLTSFYQNILRYNKYLTTNLKVLMPNDLYVAKGTTIEIYNNQVCINLQSNLHVQWVSAIGKPLKRKFVIPSNLAIGNYNLTLNIVNDELVVLYTQNIVIHVVSNILTSAKSILSIGDSLTNEKPWLNEIVSLSNNKINLVGTRGSTNLKHEGRSGWTPNNYLTATTYSYENEGLNPFWNSATGRFDWNYYKSTHSINPNMIVLFLGMNGVSSYLSTATDVKKMIDYIIQDDPTIPIVVGFPQFKGDQNAIGKQTNSDGYQTSVGNYKYLDDVNTFSFMKTLFDLLSTYSTVSFAWLPQTHDSENNYGQQSTLVNSRSSLTEIVPIDSTHPQPINGVYSGYLQFADNFYGSICGVFNK